MLCFEHYVPFPTFFFAKEDSLCLALERIVKKLF